MTYEIGKKYHLDYKTPRYYVCLSTHSVEGKNYTVWEVRSKTNDFLMNLVVYKNSDNNFIPYTPKKIIKKYGFLYKVPFIQPIDQYTTYVYDSQGMRDQKYNLISGVVPGSKFEISVGVDAD